MERDYAAAMPDQRVVVELMVAEIWVERDHVALLSQLGIFPLRGPPAEPVD